MTTIQELKNISDVYLNDTLNYQQLSAASAHYKKLLHRLAGGDLSSESEQQDIYTSSGKAIGAYWAALCLDDLMRTRQFIRGLHKAIVDKLAQANGQLHVVYAGTGPYATLLLPLISLFAKEQIRYTFLEINPLTFATMQRVVAAAGFGDYEINVVLADATTYQFQNNNVDIIVSETMQRNLANEHQVAIFLNLMKQVTPDTRFIPEKIELHLGLKKAGLLHDAPETYYKPLKKVFEVSKAALHGHMQKSRQSNAVEFEKEQTSIDAQAQQGFAGVMLFTEIQVYKEATLTVNQSSLTLPKQLLDISNDNKQGITINSRYKTGAKPELVYEIV